LAESELFGDKRGAFTGADRNRVGYLQAADRGTLLLDEVTDLPLSVQPKLLRALELRQVVPLGDSTPVSIDVRLVTASQEPLGRAVAEKRFRPDLYARLSGLVIRLPPLRERTEEVPSLFSLMLARHAGAALQALDRRVIEALCLHDWPFNVRELDLLARRLLALHGHEPVLRRTHLPAEMLEPKAQREPAGVQPVGHEAGPAPRQQPSAEMSQQQAQCEPAGAQPAGAGPALQQLCPRAADIQQRVEARREQELEALLVALRAQGGNVARAAREVGISRQRVYRLMEGRIDPDEVRKSDPPEGTGKDRT
jgi:DNA-binding NtrC family response regulator